MVYLDQMLGKGTFANVYRGAIFKDFSTHYAVKVVCRRNLQRYGDKGKKNLQNELLILQKIKHENIVHFEHFIQTQNNYYLIFEFCAGGDLQKFLKESGALDEYMAQTFAYQLGQALR